MDFINRLVWIVTSPSRVFDDIAEGRVGWWQPWAGVSVLTMLVGWLSLPIQRVVMELNSAGLSPEEVAANLDVMANPVIMALQIVVSPLVVLAIGAIMAGLTYVLVAILSPEANFRKYFTLALYAGVVGTLGAVVSTVVVRLRGVDSIRNAEDAGFTLGLDFLAPDAGTFVTSVLQSIEVFAVWSLILVGMGLMRIFGLPRGAAIGCVIPWWLIYVLMAFLGRAFGGVS